MSIPAARIYETSDFHLATALLASGRSLLSLRWDEQRAFFTFDAPALCEAAVADYWRGALKLPAKTVLESHRTLKDRLFSESRARA